MGFWDSVRNVVNSEKASKAKTPPGKVQKPVYGDKKMVKAVKPRKGKKT